MKPLRQFLTLALLCVALPAFASVPTRPKDQPAATAPASDDKLLIDGTTNGTRALPATYYLAATAAAADVNPAGSAIAAAIAAKSDLPSISTLSGTVVTLYSSPVLKTVTLAGDTTWTLTAGATAGQSVIVKIIASTALTQTVPAAYIDRSASTGTSIKLAAGVHYEKWWSDGTNLFILTDVAGLLQDAQFVFPCWGDGTGATRITTEGAGYGHFTMSGSAAKAGNYVIYRWRVPKYFDPSVPITCVWSVKLTNTDTGEADYEISMADVAASASANPSTSNAIAVVVPSDASGANGDMEQSAETALTGWAAALTPGDICYIMVARAGDTDASTVAQQDLNLTLYYGVTQ